MVNILKSINSHIVGVGSSRLRAYLPESDVDLVLFTTIDSSQHRNTLLQVFHALFKSIDNEQENIANNMILRNLEFINARTSVVCCLLNNTRVDITIDQLGAMASVIFVEEAARIVGGNQLFKRSLILLKVNK